MNTGEFVNLLNRKFPSLTSYKFTEWIVVDSKKWTIRKIGGRVIRYEERIFILEQFPDTCFDWNDGVMNTLILRQ